MAITKLAIQVLEMREQDRRIFKNPAEGLVDLIDTESERLKDAAQMIGGEWNGMFSRAHVLLLAECYAGWAIGEYKRQHGF